MPWVRTGIDRRGLNKKVAHTAQTGVPSIFLPRPSTDPRQHGLYLFLYDDEMLLMVTSSMRLSFNSLYVRTNQKACIIQIAI